MRTQRYMTVLLAASDCKHYKKSGVFNYEIAYKEQTVVTKHADQTEVTNTAYPDDYIVEDSEGAKYVVKPEEFVKRYEKTGTGKAKAVGECWGVEWIDNKMEFQSPWKSNEPMIIEPGDMLVSPNDQFTEAYRIKRSEFDKTYKEVI